MRWYYKFTFVMESQPHPLHTFLHSSLTTSSPILPREKGKFSPFQIHRESFPIMLTPRFDFKAEGGAGAAAVGWGFRYCFSAELPWLPVWKHVTLHYVPFPFWLLVIKILIGFHYFDVIIVQLIIIKLEKRYDQSLLSYFYQQSNSLKYHYEHKPLI